MSFIDFEINARLKARHMNVRQMSKATTEPEGDAVTLERSESRRDPPRGRSRSSKRGSFETHKQLRGRLEE
jgi:hypothetical protein